MLTRACIDPFSKHYSELYKLFKFDQILLLLYSVSFIYCNTYLFKFLQTQNEQNRTQTRDDFNRRRVRNLVPAKAGVLHAIALVITYVGKYVSNKAKCQKVALGILLILVYIPMYEPSIDLDVGTKCYILTVYSDLYPCIITPAGVIYAAPTVRTQMKSHLMAIWNWITEWKQRLFRENIVTAF